MSGRKPAEQPVAIPITAEPGDTCSFTGCLSIDDREAECPECRMVWRVTDSYPFRFLYISRHVRLAITPSGACP